ncbi:hypothetical protein HRbin07_00613 [bacterium HR07]|nr:hypothetical protein HRbin07_00613 [bacterium HR07]
MDQSHELAHQALLTQLIVNACVEQDPHGALNAFDIALSGKQRHAQMRPLCKLDLLPRYAEAQFFVSLQILRQAYPRLVLAPVELLQEVHHVRRQAAKVLPQRGLLVLQLRGIAQKELLWAQPFKPLDVQLLHHKLLIFFPQRRFVTAHERYSQGLPHFDPCLVASLQARRDNAPCSLHLRL